MTDEFYGSWKYEMIRYIFRSYFGYALFGIALTLSACNPVTAQDREDSWVERVATILIGMRSESEIHDLPTVDEVPSQTLEEYLQAHPC